MADFNLGDMVKLTYNVYDLDTDQFLGKKVALAKVTRVWPNQKSVTLKLVETGSTFVRQTDSPTMEKVATN